ncbi:MAG: RagB/SusD family nutrient uptake outer membrane protein, partial [Chitinophagaceae bacterium]
MKKLNILLLCLMVLALGSCNNNFMNRLPLDQITDQNYWHTENDLRLYCNSFYPTYIVGFGDGWGDAITQPYGYTQAAIVYG